MTRTSSTTRRVPVCRTKLDGPVPVSCWAGQRIGVEHSPEANTATNRAPGARWNSERNMLSTLALLRADPQDASVSQRRCVLDRQDSLNLGLYRCFEPGPRTDIPIIQPRINPRPTSQVSSFIPAEPPPAALDADVGNRSTRELVIWARSFGQSVVERNEPGSVVRSILPEKPGDSGFVVTCSL